MSRLPLLLLPLLFASSAAAAQSVNPQIDYPGFAKLTATVGPHRKTRLLTWAEFEKTARQPNALVLDARSAEAYAAGHIKGAVNLPFTDFTAASLKHVIGDRDRPILIYCNNNFANDEPPVTRKMVELALNIQTFINLVGYGYPNVWELNEVVDFKDPKVGWVKGPAVQERAAIRARASAIPGRARR